jgi:hypothetical protein
LLSEGDGVRVLPYLGNAWSLWLTRPRMRSLHLSLAFSDYSVLAKPSFVHGPREPLLTRDQFSTLNTDSRRTPNGSVEKDVIIIRL